LNLEKFWHTLPRGSLKLAQPPSNSTGEDPPMTKKTLLWILAIAMLSTATGCLFRNHGKCDSDNDRSRYNDDCRKY
jgi:hypothetical protein